MFSENINQNNIVAKAVKTITLRWFLLINFGINNIIVAYFLVKLIVLLTKGSIARLQELSLQRLRTGLAVLYCKLKYIDWPHRLAV